MLNVPPLDRGPFIKSSQARIEGPKIKDFNQRLHGLHSDFTRSYPDVSALLFNTNLLFSNILNNPETYPQTADLRNVTGYCEAYDSFDLPRTDFDDASCLVPVNQYFWLNGLHPTSSVHEALAAQVAMAIE